MNGADVVVDGRPGRLRRPRVVALGYVAIFATAVLVRLVPVVRGGGLFTSVSYDGSVYYGAAAGLAHGLWPYQDFLLLHPPGIAVITLPFALIGRWLGDPVGMAAARVGFLAIGASSAVLVAVVLRRSGRGAAWTGGMFYAVFFPAVFSERSVALEAAATCLVVGGLAVLTVRGAATRPTLVALAGALVGLSVGVKIWGLPLLVALAIWCWREWGLRVALRFLAGGIGAVSVLCLPFFIRAPGTMWRMVVLDQLGRARTPGLQARVVDILGLTPLTTFHVGPTTTLAVAAIALASALGASVLAVRTPIGRMAVVLLASSVGVLAATPSWFLHYGALTAGPLALVVGAAIGEVAGRGWGLLTRGLAASVCLGLVLSAWACTRATFGSPVAVGGLVAAAADRPGCVTADEPTALILTNLLQRNLDRGCPLVIDLGGYSYDLPHSGPVVSRSRNRAWQRFALAYFREGDTTMIMRFRDGRGFDAATAAEIDRWRVLARATGVRMLQPV